jgi:hypothetical protein
MKKIWASIKRFFIKVWDLAFYVLGAPYNSRQKNWTGMKRMKHLEDHKTLKPKKHTTEQIK